MAFVRVSTKIDWIINEFIYLAKVINETNSGSVMDYPTPPGSDNSTYPEYPGYQS